MQKEVCDKEEQFTQIMEEIRQYYDKDFTENNEESEEKTYKGLLAALENHSSIFLGGNMCTVSFKERVRKEAIANAKCYPC